MKQTASCSRCRWMSEWVRHGMRDEVVRECHFNPPTLLVDPRFGEVIQLLPKAFESGFCHNFAPRQDGEASV